MPARTRRDFLISTACAGAAATLPMRARARPDTRPNIVVIVVDDMRFDEYGAGGHPYLETPHIDALAASGAVFTNAYHTTPLCSPNRASILTGQYASLHGIIDNTSRGHASHKLRTYARELQQAGYETAHIGKWHMGHDASPRPGYDYWVSFAGQGRSVNPELYEEGRLHEVKGYTTDLFTDRAIAFATRNRSRPFALYIGHKAVHPDIQQREDGSLDTSSNEGFVPAPRHRGRYAGRRFPRRPNFGLTAAERQAKPVVAAALDERQSPQNLAYFGRPDADTTDEAIQARAEMMLAVDEGVGRLVEALRSQSLLENTLFVFMSDNGSFFGEHGLGVERRLAYEESIKCPLIVAQPGVIEPGLRIEPFTLSIDIAPTLLDAAGLKPPSRMQGRSAMPLLRGQSTPWRDAFLVEYYAHEVPLPWTAMLDYRAVRMGQYKLIRWIRNDDAAELYDLQADPYERRNVIANPAYAKVAAAARKRLSSLVVESLGLVPPT